MELLADVSLEPDHSAGAWPPPVGPARDEALIDLREEQPGPAVPTGPWGRPPTLDLEPIVVRADSPVGSGPRLTGPPPAPPGAPRPARTRRRTRWGRGRAALAEGVVAAALIAGLAIGFAPSQASPAWKARAGPVVQSLLDDVAAIEQPGAAPGRPPPLGADLARARQLGGPPDPASARLWATALLALSQVQAELAGSGPARMVVRAQLAEAGDALLALADQH